MNISQFEIELNDENKAFLINLRDNFFTVEADDELVSLGVSLLKSSKLWKSIKPKSLWGIYGKWDGYTIEYLRKKGYNISCLFSSLDGEYYIRAIRLGIKFLLTGKYLYRVTK